MTIRSPGRFRRKGEGHMIIIEKTELDRLAADLCKVIDGIAGAFGPGATQTVNGDIDCDPNQPGKLLSWQYGVHLDSPSEPDKRLTSVVVPSLQRAGWHVKDRSTARELVAQFSRDGAHLTVHVARKGGDVAIMGSTRCVAAF
ncbi:hypothetical protein [Amycolatopsis sp. NPDC059657]|uniref:hypothetical protein n=1 Tax=Amycolatopsis sp. NPDC059657 TaxID=3346899 RepID=UPI003670F4E0